MPDPAAPQQAEPSAEALEFAKDVRQELMRLAFESGSEVAFPAGHLATIARLASAFAAQAVAAEREACALWHGSEAVRLLEIAEDCRKQNRNLEHAAVCRALADEHKILAMRHGTRSEKADG